MRYLDRFLGLSEVSSALGRRHEHLLDHGRLIAHSDLGLNWLWSISTRNCLFHSPVVHFLLDAVEDDVSLLDCLVALVSEAFVLRLEELLGEVL